MVRKSLFVIAAGLMLAATALPQTTGTEATLPTNNLPFQKIGREDLLGVNVYGAPELTRTVRVNAEGKIRLPMLPDSIHVEGMLPSDVEVLIGESLKREKLFVDPFVTVTMVEYHSRPISVVGAVKTPVIFQAVGNVSLLDAIARAGGVADSAGGEIIITKPNGDSGVQSVQRVPVRGLIEGADPNYNIKLQGGEEIRVPTIGVIVVAGNVKKSGVFPVQEGGTTSVLTAIAQAEGLGEYTPKIAYIYRPDDQGTKHEIPVNLAAIRNRKEPDVSLQAKDVLYIPDNNGKKITLTALDRLSQMAASIVSGVLIYSSARPE